MANIFQSNRCQLLATCITAFTFTCVTIVPLPGCQVAGQWLLNAGFGILSAEGLERWSDYDRDQRKK